LILSHCRCSAGVGVAPSAGDLERSVRETHYRVHGLIPALLVGMALLTDFMRRLGWIRLSDYDLAIDADGKLVNRTELLASHFGLPSAPQLSSADLSASLPSASPSSALALGTAPLAAQPMAEPIAAPTAASAMAPPAPASPAPAPAAEASADDDDEWAWKAALAKARAAEEAELAASEQVGVADTSPLRGSEGESDADDEAAREPKAPPTYIGYADTDKIPPRQKKASPPPMPVRADADKGEDEDEQDWEALMAAARARAEQEDAATVVEPDYAELQVEHDARPANDTAVARPANDSADDEADDWGKLMTAAQARSSEEDERKRRGMLEVQRLQRRALEVFRPSSTILGRPPQRPPKSSRRLAAGTNPPPTRHDDTQLDMPALPFRAAPTDDTKVDTQIMTRPKVESAPLPRITARLGRS
jgi:hypothetical protein